jgi:serine/threonine-protein kinase
MGPGDAQEAVSCPGRAELLDFVVGKLPLGWLEEVAAHVGGCSRCAAILGEAQDEEDPLIAGLRHCDRGEKPSAEAAWERLAARARDLASAPPTEPPPPAESEDLAGARVGAYDVQEELGRGGMGVVYKAWHLESKRLVALKVIRNGALASADQVSRFRAEALAVARLRHANIVQIYEIGEHNALPFFSLEFVGGGSLEAKLKGGPLAPRQAAQLVETLARAIHYAHQHEVVHRDLKPANVLLTPEGIPKVTDFGLAKRLDADLGLTDSEAIMGTPNYMAPEQAWGKAKEVGPAADIYALGGTLYAMLTGGPPFRGTNRLDVYNQVRYQKAVPPTKDRPEVPPALSDICLKCLAKKPEQRYVSAEALADTLRRFLLDAESEKSGGAAPTKQGGSDDLHEESPHRSWYGLAGERPEIPGYEILSEVAYSSMSVIYLARQSRLNRRVALKIVRGGLNTARRCYSASEPRPRRSPTCAMRT